MHPARETSRTHETLKQFVVLFTFTACSHQFCFKSLLQLFKWIRSIKNKQIFSSFGEVRNGGRDKYTHRVKALTATPVRTNKVK